MKASYLYVLRDPLPLQQGLRPKKAFIYRAFDDLYGQRPSSISNKD